MAPQLLKESLLFQAKKSLMDTNYACAIVYRNEIISIACNSYCTDRCRLNQSCFLHP